MIQRVLPERVLAAYQKTGMTPIFGVSYTPWAIPNQRSADAITAVATADKGTLWHSIEGLDFDYLDGFLEGFDGQVLAPRCHTTSTDLLLLGYKDGQDCRSAVKERLL